MIRGTGAWGHRGTVASLQFRASVPPCLCAALLACTDPRARPVPPDVRLTFAGPATTTSPDTLFGSLYLFDADGLDQLQLTLKAADGSPLTDSLFAFAFEPEVTRGVAFEVPAGRPAGSILRIVARARDAAGFWGADSTVFTIE